jgi:hypothetical protein
MYLVPEIKEAIGTYNSLMSNTGNSNSSVVSVNPKSQNDGAMIDLMTEINKGGPEALQNMGDDISKVGYALTVSVIGAEIGIPLAAAGNTLSTVGVTWETVNKASNGDFKGAGVNGAFEVMKFATDKGLNRIPGGKLGKEILKQGTGMKINLIKEKVKQQ